ncbi:SDR family oxidoreductase [Solimonas sp. K1W22B-7]|uniref:SDR family NAD(P)-dependent oxidoreductase n=1 Tax=Solimonas sp. K1W22B-7 TaxID=2303331 RepID=UPI000E333D62|nr:SDR family oxidoreductase [Solimonas sp. K1W22B-7]AXQ29337.1 SDR family oxidoreductase [Solimonas sp. K1W22B-7]
MSQSSKRHILITGGGSGLGAATARLLAAQGHRLTLVGRRADALEQVAAPLCGMGADVRVQACDIGDTAAIDALYARFGTETPDGLVGSAALLLIKPFMQTTLEEYDQVMDVNVRGLWYLCQQAFRTMSARGGGDIVLVSSLSGIRGLQIAPGKSVYTPSKHAVTGLTEALAFDGREFNIRVNAVAPGYMKTEMNARFGLYGGAQAEEVAPSVAYLLDRAQSGATTGTTLEVFCNG